ncbi:MAG: hypothetical protein CMI31_07930 [Opitutae bacterium]|nr:hypothetical protein [Opitutae bacterium]
MRMILVVACVLGALSVVLGAAGAHALAEELSADSAQGRAFEAALRYHQLHSVVLLVLGFAGLHWGGVFGSRLRIACWFFLAGMILFCGSLYGFAFGGPEGLTKISPFGGTTLILAWLAAAWAALAARGASAS